MNANLSVLISNFELHIDKSELSPILGNFFNISITSSVKSYLVILSLKASRQYWYLISLIISPIGIAIPILLFSSYYFCIPKTSKSKSFNNRGNPKKSSVKGQLWVILFFSEDNIFPEDKEFFGYWGIYTSLSLK